MSHLNIMSVFNTFKTRNLRRFIPKNDRDLQTVIGKSDRVTSNNDYGLQSFLNLEIYAASLLKNEAGLWLGAEKVTI